MPKKSLTDDEIREGFRELHKLVTNLGFEIIAIRELLVEGKYLTTDAVAAKMTQQAILTKAAQSATQKNPTKIQ